MGIFEIKQYLIKKPSLLSSFSEPYDQHCFLYKGHSFSYIDTGNHSKTLFFIHGNPTSKELWLPLLGELSSSYRCVAIDLFDKNPKSAYLPTLSDSADMLLAFLDSLKIQTTVWITHDWGVTVGLKCREIRPFSVSHFVFMEGLFYPVTLKYYFFIPWFLAIVGKAPLINHILLVNFNIFVRWLLPLGCSTKLPSSWHQKFLSTYQSPFRRNVIKNWILQIPMSNNEELNELRESFYASNIPKLAFQVSPGLATKRRAMEDLKKRCMNLSIIHLGQGIHFVPLDNPSEISNGINSFLSSNHLIPDHK